MRPFSSPRGKVIPPSSRLWRTESEPNRFRPCGTKAIPSASNWRCVFPLIRLPSKRTSPLRGTSMPNSVLRTVDLPAPFGPISSVISPLRASSVSSLRIVTLGEYPATTLSNSMMLSATADSLIVFSYRLGCQLSYLLSCLNKLPAPAGSPEPRKEGPPREPCLRPCRSRADKAS